MGTLETIRLNKTKKESEVKGMKRLLAALLTVCLGISMIGCGSSSQEKPVSDGSSEEKSEEGSTDAADQEKETSDEKFVIGYSNRLDSDTFLVDLKNAFGDIAAEDSSVEVIYADANNDSQKQLEQIDNFFVQDVDCLVICPNDRDSIVSAVEAANEKGIPVIIFSTDSAGGDYYFVGISNIDCGYMQGVYMKETLPEGAKVLYLGGSSGFQISVDRREGFYEGLGDRIDDIEILSEQECDYTMDEGMTIMEDWIQTFPEFDAVVAVNDQSALGAIQALIGANKLEGVAVAGIDAIDDAKDAVKNGEMAMTVMQDPVAQAQAVYDAVKTLQSGGEPEKVVEVPVIEITADNVEEYMD